MFKRRQSREEQIIIGLLVGGAIGSLVSFLFAPVKGKDLRKEIKDDMDQYLKVAKDQSQKIFSETKDMTNGMIERAQNVFDMSKKYATGVIDVPRENVEKEISRLRKAFTAAVDAYKSYEAEVPTEQAVSEIFENYNDEGLPKQEGMGRRVEP
ncbi:MAG: YtxH domain-containing protein [Bacillota bacterium]